MTDDEEHLMRLGVHLCDGIQSMIVTGRLRLASVSPSDREWLSATLQEMAELCQRVKLD